MALLLLMGEAARRVEWGLYMSEIYKFKKHSG